VGLQTSDGLGHKKQEQNPSQRTKKRAAAKIALRRKRREIEKKLRQMK